jgi:hypothetical protein
MAPEEWEVGNDSEKKATEFKEKFMALLREYAVGLNGLMHFRIGDQELVLDTTLIDGVEEINNE